MGCHVNLMNYSAPMKVRRRSFFGFDWLIFGTLPQKYSSPLHYSYTILIKEINYPYITRLIIVGFFEMPLMECIGGIWL